MWVAFANAKATHIFSAKNISIYAILSDQSFNITLTNNIISFEQLGPGCWVTSSQTAMPLSPEPLQKRKFQILPHQLIKTRQSAQWGMYTPNQRYHQFLTSTKYVALTQEMAGWMNSMLIAISPKPLGRRITKFNKRSWWYSYINLDAIFFTFIWNF